MAQAKVGSFKPKYYNGKKYYFFSNHRHKEFAISAANRMREKGHLARVIYDPSIDYYRMYATMKP